VHKIHTDIEMLYKVNSLIRIEFRVKKLPSWILQKSAPNSKKWNKQ